MSPLNITQPLGINGLFYGYYKVMSNIPKSWDSYQPLYKCASSVTAVRCKPPVLCKNLEQLKETPKTLRGCRLGPVFFVFSPDIVPKNIKDQVQICYDYADMDK